MPFKELLKKINDENTNLASDGKAAAEFTSFIDTGSYAFNALLSGSLYGGMPDNKITCLAGESGVGKTYLGLSIAKAFQNSEPNAVVIDYDTEGATTKQMLIDRGIDPDRFIISEKNTIEEFKFHIVKTLNAYEELEEKFPLMIMLNSLGQLSTSKEVKDANEEKESRDMGRAQLIKGTFRIIDLKLSKLKIPLLFTNHTYTVVGAYFPTRKAGGGTGPEYSADQIIFLSKKKEKDSDNEVIGNILTAKTQKSRLTVENKEVEILVKYDSGLDRYYGLIDLAVKYNVFKKLSKQLELPDGTKVFEKAINKNPEKYYTSDIMERLEEACKTEFLYGNKQ